jgi:hypothetical protein
VDIVAGHAIWTAVAGATIALALLLRTRGKQLAYAIGASGIVIVTLDHVRHNYGIRATDLLAGLLDGVGLNGWLVIVLFVGLTAAVIAADAWIIYRSPPRPPAHRSAAFDGGLEGWLRAWEIRRATRALAMANFHVHRASGADLVQAGREGLRLDLLLGMDPKDFDVATDATPEEVAEMATIVREAFDEQALALPDTVLLPSE